MYSEKPYVLVLGASVVDIFGFCCCDYRSYNSNPGKIRMSFGGVCRNIAENLARVGVNTKFISVLGDDENGQSMLNHSALLGYDMKDSLILEGESTPTYMAILDDKGEMVSAIVDMKSIDKMGCEFIESKAHIIEKAQYTILDTDKPKNLEYILKNFKGYTKFVLDPVSAEKAKNIKHLVKYFHTIKPNRHEAEVLADMKIETEEDLRKAGNYFLSLGVKNVFISLDEEGIYYTNGAQEGRIKSNEVKVLNVTGAGDAFVAGLAYGYIENLSIQETIKVAMSMAVITISHKDTIHPDMNYSMVQKVLESLSWEEKSYN